jgi:hypothetical protein
MSTMRAIVLTPDLMTPSRVAEALAGHEVRRIDDPVELPTPREVDTLVVDWGAREASWEGQLRTWASGADEGHAPRILLFGPHADVAAHAAARQAGLGPMRARSRMVGHLRLLVDR